MIWGKSGLLSLQGWCYYWNVIERLRQALSRRQKHRIVDNSMAASAVLIPLIHKNGEYHILFTRRTQTVQYHKGQISFPGGAYEAEDSTLLDTALRESTEEIGLAREVVDILGELDDTPTVTSGYVISPFVGLVQEERPLTLHPLETEEILEIPVSALLTRDCLRPRIDVIDGKEIKTYAYHCGSNVIWGATARILGQFLDIYVRATVNTKN